MNRRPTRKKEVTRLVLTYIAMTLSVVTIVAAMVFVLLGYRIDTNSGQIEQSALLQFESIPSGATVLVDGKPLRTKTPTKSTVLSGSHTVVMKKDGYNDWTKTFDAVPGTLTWLNYARLIPSSLSSEKLFGFKTVFGSASSFDGKSIIIQQNAVVPTFDVIDLKSDTPKRSSITISEMLYSEAKTPGVSHSFAINQFDKSGRYVLILHSFSDKKEWILLDTKDETRGKNISRLLDIEISSIVFSGTSGNLFFALINTDIRKLDLSSETISKPLVSGVAGFELYDTGVIAYIGKSQADATKRVVGIYIDGNSTSHIIKTVEGDANIPLRVATSRYFDTDYIAISYGEKVDIISGTYPNSATDDGSMTNLASYSFEASIDSLSFSPAGDYFLAVSGTNVTSYNIEHQTTTNFTVSSPNLPIKWLDNNHIWTDFDGKLAMREFDGANTSVIGDVEPGHAVLLSSNDRYIYSISKTSEDIELRRTKLQTP